MSNPAAVDSYGAWAAPIAVLMQRVVRAHQPGGLLDGMRSFAKVAKMGETKEQNILSPAGVITVTADMLPRLTFGGVSCQENIPRFGGSLKDGVVITNLVRELCATHIIQFIIQTDLKAGWICMDPANSKRRGHYDWIGRLLQAMEITAAEVPDSSLEQSCVEPVRFLVAPGESDSEMYYESIITVEAVTHGFYPGQRIKPPEA